MIVVIIIMWRKFLIENTRDLDLSIRLNGKGFLLSNALGYFFFFLIIKKKGKE